MADAQPNSGLPIENGIHEDEKVMELFAQFQERDVEIQGMDLVLDKNTKDTPCKFHDGFSESCWKGPSCPYSHKRYTGEQFAKKHPNIAFAASASHSSTTVHLLPDKIVLNTERQIKCRVTHVDSPSQFFIKAAEQDAPCLCAKVDINIAKFKKMDRLAKTHSTHVEPMDDYFYGFAACAPAENETEEDPLAKLKPSTMANKLHTFLSRAFNYQRFQIETYKPHVELVAANVSNKWQRALVLFQRETVPSHHSQDPCILVQLLETGEKAFLPAKDVCQLPENFSTEPTSVFRCMLWGFSPIYLQWAKSATSKFKELVTDKKLIIIVKNRGVYDKIFERDRPYSVQVRVVQEDESWVDVGEQLFETGYCLRWNPIPFRPFTTKFVDTKGLDVIALSRPNDLPQSALEVENRRLELHRAEEDSTNDSTENDYCDSEHSKDTCISLEIYTTSRDDVTVKQTAKQLANSKKSVVRR